MGFADLSLVEIAEDYSLSVEDVLHLCDQLGIAYKTPKTRLALEDAKAIILEIMAQREGSGFSLRTQNPAQGPESCLLGSSRQSSFIQPLSL